MTFDQKRFEPSEEGKEEDGDRLMEVDADTGRAVVPATDACTIHISVIPSTALIQELKKKVRISLVED